MATTLNAFPDSRTQTKTKNSTIVQEFNRIQNRENFSKARNRSQARENATENSRDKNLLLGKEYERGVESGARALQSNQGVLKKPQTGKKIFGFPPRRRRCGLVSVVPGTALPSWYQYLKSHLGLSGKRSTCGGKLKPNFQGIRITLMYYIKWIDKKQQVLE